MSLIEIAVRVFRASSELCPEQALPDLAALDAHELADIGFCPYFRAALNYSPRRTDPCSSLVNRGPALTAVLLWSAPVV